MKVLHTPLSREDARALRCGESCLITGTIYTARDAAHKRLCELAAKGEPLPFDIEGAIIYFVGPTPAKPGQVIGSAGPTTSGRMDPFSPTLIEKGQVCMIGKGVRNQTVHDAMQKYGCVYMVAIGGAGAVIADSVKSLEVVAYDELGCESVKRLTVENFPAIVSMDAQGGSLYATGIAQFRTADKD